MSINVHDLKITKDKKILKNPKNVHLNNEKTGEN